MGYNPIIPHLYKGHLGHLEGEQPQFPGMILQGSPPLTLSNQHDQGAHSRENAVEGFHLAEIFAGRNYRIL